MLALWAGAGAEATHTDDAASIGRLIATSPDALLLAVDDGGVIVGSIIAGWDGWRGSVYRLVVAPTHRRQGLGRRLLAQAEESLRARGARRSATIVVDDDEGAMGCWRSVAWEEQTHRVRFVKG